MAESNDEQNDKILDYIDSFSEPAEFDFFNTPQKAKLQAESEKLDRTLKYYKTTIGHPEWSDQMDKAVLKGEIYGLNEAIGVDAKLKAKSWFGDRVDIQTSLVSPTGQRIIMSPRLQEIFDFKMDSYVSKEDANELASALQTDGVAVPEIDKVNATINKYGVIVMQRGIYAPLKILLEESLGRDLALYSPRNKVVPTIILPTPEHGASLTSLKERLVSAPPAVSNAFKKELEREVNTPELLAHKEIALPKPPVVPLPKPVMPVLKPIVPLPPKPIAPPLPKLVIPPAPKPVEPKPIPTPPVVVPPVPKPEAPKPTPPPVIVPPPVPAPKPAMPFEYKPNLSKIEEPLKSSAPHKPISGMNQDAAWQVSSKVVAPKFDASTHKTPERKHGLPKIRNRIAKHGIGDLNGLHEINDLDKIEAAHLRQGPLASQLDLIKGKIAEIARKNDMLPISLLPVFVQSPLFQTYLRAGSMLIDRNMDADNQVDLEVVMDELESKGQDILSQEEFEAIADLKKSLESMSGL